MGDDERVQLGWRVSRETKQQFERFVDETRGEIPGRKGRALEDAMREYMRNDRLATVEEQLDEIAESLGVEKKNGKRTAVADGRYEVPEGKNPGDVEQRRRAVINALLDRADEDKLPSDEKGQFVTRTIVKQAVESVAKITSDKTVDKYVRKILKQGPFRGHPNRTAAWLVER